MQKFIYIGLGFEIFFIYNVYNFFFREVTHIYTNFCIYYICIYNIWFLIFWKSEMKNPLHFLIMWYKYIHSRSIRTWCGSRACREMNTHALRLFSLDEFSSGIPKLRFPSHSGQVYVIAVIRRGIFSVRSMLKDVISLKSARRSKSLNLSPHVSRDKY